MATIIERRRKDGKMAYSAQVVIKQDGKIVHRRSKTFDRRQAANAWAHKYEAEMKRPGALDAGKQLTLGELIDRYLDQSQKEIGRTKEGVLKAVKRYDIAKMACSEIRSHHMVVFAQKLAETVQPQTVGNYMSHVSAVFSVARKAWGIDLDQDVMRGAHEVAAHLGVISKSRQRTRRPTLAELERILTFFVERSERSPASSPMKDIVLFALFSTRRLSEILRIGWSDLDVASSRVLVRDMKHPGQKAGNNVWCELVPEAMSVISRTPRLKARIFPYGDDAVGAAFTRAMQFLEIDDLHFHDLRHEGISRLFEMGWTIPQVASVSGHRNWQSLQRYTHLRMQGDRYDGWKWLK